MSISILVSENLKPDSLKNSPVVVDGQNFFYKLYELSGLQYRYGCESDNYADYLRNRLEMFKKANIDCYFIFKGGHKDEKTMHNMYNRKQGKFKPPIFMKEIYKQVLDEMGFNYTICPFESKQECIAFSQRNNCPVISNDTFFCFSSIPYIPSTSLHFNEETSSIDCGIFMMASFMQKYHLNIEKIAMFVAVTSEQYRCIPDKNMPKFLKSTEISSKNLYDRNLEFLKWLKNATEKYAERVIMQYAVMETYYDVKDMIMKWIRMVKATRAPTEYLENGNNIEITRSDKDWFEKGVASKHIAIPLVNIHYHDTVFGSPVKTSKTAQDAMLLSMDIIKYICNLLANFQKREITFCNGEKVLWKKKVDLTDSVPQPKHHAIRSVFENGWLCLEPGLFEHFLAENLKGINFGELKDLPDDSKLLVIALIYFAIKKTDVNVTNEAYCVLLCYAVLSANAGEKQKSMECLKDYLEGEGSVEILHPLVEFQHCLEYLNYLNRLCGESHKPTIYSKTYNGTFVFKMLLAMKTADGNFLDQLETKLADVTNVLESFSLHIKVYRTILNKEINE